MKNGYVRVALAASIVALCVLAWASGLTGSLEHVHAVKRFFAHYGVSALVLYLGLFVLLGSTGVPPMLFMIPARFLWPDPLAAFAVSFGGGLGAALFGFWLSRHIGRAFLSRHIPERLHRFDARVRQNSLRTVIVLRLLFFLMPPVNWLLGVSQLRTSTFIAGTMIGALPGTLFFTFVGHTLVGWLLRQQFGAIVVVAAVVAGVLLLWQLTRQSG